MKEEQIKKMVNDTKGEMMIHLEDIANRNGMQLDAFCCSVSFSKKGGSVAGFVVTDVNDDNEHKHVQRLPEKTRLQRIFIAFVETLERFEKKYS